VTELANLLGEFDSDKEAAVTEILDQLYDEAHEDGFDGGQAAAADSDDFYFGDDEEFDTGDDY
jgi:hypothetical protein